MFSREPQASAAALACGSRLNRKVSRAGRYLAGSTAMAPVSEM
jgi:hypothetical protein